MKRGLDHGLLVNDLNANHFRIRNLVTLESSNLISIDDSRLNDRRIILNGSVTNDSVADDAAIDQSKFNLSGDIPTTWFGADDTHAARGDLAEFKSNRDIPGGYASLGSDLKMPSGSTPTSGTGTVHDIVFELPVGELTTDPIATGTDMVSTGYWAAQNAETFFGNFSGASDRPTFQDGRVFPVDLIPGFDASRIVSGTFNIDQLPIASGVGVGHSAGLVPHPGTPEITPSAQPTDYLARDMTYKAMKPVVNYQPQLTPPSITLQSYYMNQAYVNITTKMSKDSIFYSLDSGPFTEVVRTGFNPTLPILVPIGTTVNAYVAQIGYNNSEISMYTIPPNSNV